jgi:hypothetical protein
MSYCLSWRVFVVSCPPRGRPMAALYDPQALCNREPCVEGSGLRTCTFYLRPFFTHSLLLHCPWLTGFDLYIPLFMSNLRSALAGYTHSRSINILQDIWNRQASLYGRINFLQFGLLKLLDRIIFSLCILIIFRLHDRGRKAPRRRTRSRRFIEEPKPPNQRMGEG